MPPSFSTTPALADLLRRDHLLVFFQAVVDFSQQRVIAYVGSARGAPDTPWHIPEALRTCANVLDKNTELAWLNLRSVLHHARRMQLEDLLFVEMEMAVFATLPLAQTLALLESYQIAPSQLGLSLRGGQADIDNLLPAVIENVRAYRATGVSIALEQVGENSLRWWAALPADYVKIAPYLCQNLSESPRQREFLRSLRMLAARIATPIIATGIDSTTIYKELCDLGFSLGQGDYFAKPQASPPRRIPARLFAHQTYPTMTRTDTVACLVLTRQPIMPDLHIAEVGALFHELPQVYALAVVNHKQVPLGIVRRHDILHLLTSRYGLELHGRKRIHTVMDNSPLIFDSALSLEDASQQVTMHTHNTPEHDFIITRDGHYVGIGRVMDLLRHITELQIRNARYANPLTLLPGNVPIQEQLEMLLREQCAFQVAYCDLDNFKPFNDVYGYDQGDEVIKTLSRILRQHAPPPDFVGHVGGDDFIVIFRCPDWEARCQAILNDFSALAENFYRPEDRAKGGIYTYDRQGVARFFPLLSVSIGVVQPDPHRCHSHHDIAALATEAKHQAKQSQGNSLFIERRRAPLCLSAPADNEENSHV
jgi:diguanylate cyclase (GGDEF)-like protein